MFSIYFYCFNIKKYFPNIEDTVKNFTSFADEIICSTLSYQKEDCNILHNLESKYSNFKVIESDISLDYNRFDGYLKTIALEKCTQPLRIIADADERFVISNKNQWITYGRRLLENKYNFDGILLPVIDLYSNKLKVKKNSNVGLKFRLHKDTVKSRGVPDFAELSDGLFRTDLSDSTEPLLDNLKLANFCPILDKEWLKIDYIQNLVHVPYVLHEGYLDLQRRANIGKEFWKEKWEQRSSHEENVVTDLNILNNEELINHNLPLE